MKDAIAHDNTDNEDDSHNESMETLDTIASISEQLKSILDRLKKLDIIENSAKNIEANLANLKAGTAKPAQFEKTAAKDILTDLKETTTFNGNTCKELQDRVDKHSSRINSLMASERKLRDQMNEVTSKTLYLEAYSRRENIKFFSIPEDEEEDTEEVLRHFMENELGYRNARTGEIQRVHRIAGRRGDSGPRPIIPRFLR